jgi:nitrogen-specific signal transduction histidine kinase
MMKSGWRSAGKIEFFTSKNLARKVLCVIAMSSLENIYKKMAEAAAGADAQHETTQNSAQYVPPAVAHELNNIIAIIRGYADRLLFKHGENPALEPHLKLISEAAKRAAIIVHDALPPNPSPAVRQNPPPSQQPTS